MLWPLGEFRFFAPSRSRHGHAVITEKKKNREREKEIERGRGRGREKERGTFRIFEAEDYTKHEGKNMTLLFFSYPCVLNIPFIVKMNDKRYKKL